MFSGDDLAVRPDFKEVADVHQDCALKSNKLMVHGCVQSGISTFTRLDRRSLYPPFILTPDFQASHLILNRGDVQEQVVLITRGIFTWKRRVMVP